jgi:uncharacterized protein (UPF0335 family)
MTTTLDDLAARIARLEEHQGLATKADLVEVRRDIADLATGIGSDLRAMRQDMEGMRADVAWMRSETTEIRRLLQHRAFRWWWQS